MCIMQGNYSEKEVDIFLDRLCQSYYLFLSYSLIILHLFVIIAISYFLLLVVAFK